MVAYFVAQSGEQPPSAEELRSHLREKLPVYAIPSHFVLLARMPLNPNGKIDKARLPFPDTVSSHSRKASIGQHVLTPVQQSVITCWKEVLHRDVGLKDNFFDLGGHSVSATMLVFALRKHFQADLPLSLLYDHPTVLGMAEAITRSSGDVMPSSPDAFADASKGQDLNLESESVLEHDISLKAPISTAPYKVIFLTGSTGFLGGYILRDLLIQFVGCQVMCLVRGADGLARIVQNLKANHIFDESFVSRIKVLEGSLDCPLFGLSQAAFDELTHSVDAVVHNGAMVNWVLPYSQMKASNVGATRDALKLCCSGPKTKPMVFISSSSVLDSPGYIQAKLVTENEPLSIEQVKKN